MTVQATDVPGNSAVPRSDTASVTINVLRNPNAPRFTSNVYNATISEYLPIQQAVVRVTAVDDDPTGVSYIFSVLSSFFVVLYGHIPFATLSTPNIF